MAAVASIEVGSLGPAAHRPRSSGDTIPNCLGEFREIRESKQRTGIAPYGLRQARLEPLALSVSGRERMFNGWAAASGAKRIDLSAGIAWFGDILKIAAPFVEIGPRSIFAKSAVGVRQRQWGRVCAGPDPAGPGRRGA